MLLATAVLLLTPIPGLPLLLQDLEDSSLNWRFRFRGPVTVPPEVVILGVGESAFRSQELPEDAFLLPEVREWMKPRWEHWDRRVFALALERLMDAGARAVGFDFVFLGEMPTDAALAETFARYAESTVLAHRIIYQTDERGQVQITVEEPTESIFTESGDAPELGLVNVFPDDDGILRRTRLGLNQRLESLLVRDELNRFTGDLHSVEPSDFILSLMLLRAAGEAGPESVSAIDSHGINFYGQSGSFPIIPIESLFLKGLWDGPSLDEGIFFKDKIVLVGPLSEIRFKDVQAVPTGVLFGVEVHANILGNLLENSLLQPLGGYPGRWISLLAALLAVSIFLLPLSFLSRFFLVSLCLLLFAAVSQWFFINAHLLIPMAAPLLAFCGVALVGGGHDFLRARYEKLRIKRLFGTYLSPELVRQMVDAGEDPELGGEETEITAFFSDVEGFSSFSETLSSSDLVELMNRYLGGMTDILLTEGGTLDKYVGDAIVALFGAPVRCADHAARACRCALLMQQRLNALRDEWAGEGAGQRWPAKVGSMRARIGLNTGKATVGNMGSRQRFNYTMMGDMVNLAARCESGAKQAGVYILVTEATYRAASRGDATLVFRYLDTWRVKGREEPARVYELLGFQSDLDAATEECLKEYQRGIEAYFARDWALAMSAFTKAESLEPNTRAGMALSPSSVLAERCRAFQEAPPPKDWDGVYRLTSK